MSAPYCFLAPFGVFHYPNKITAILKVNHHIFLLSAEMDEFSDSFHQLISNATNGIHQFVLDIIKNDRSLGSFVFMMREIFSVANTIDSQLLKMFPPEVLMACKPGCSHCCKNTVVTTKPVYAVYSIYHFKYSENPERFGQFREQLGKKGKDCPFLREDICSNYDARPLVCRMYHSYDLDECLKRRFQRSLTMGTMGLISVAKGLEDAVTDLGLDSRDIAFHKAVGLMISQEGTAERWLAGDNVFEPCSHEKHPDDSGPRPFHAAL